MNVVLDTNVVVSGLLTPSGNCGRILDLVIDGQLTTLLDARILREYERVCLEPRLHLDPVAVRHILQYLGEFSEKVIAPPLDTRLPDPDDLPFLEVASAAAAILITGNRKHFPRREVAAVRVASPAEFMELLRHRQA